MSLKRLWFLAPVLFVLLTFTAMMAALRTWSAPSPVAHTEVAQDADADQLTPSRTSATRSCGVFRWSVKTGTDGAAGSVNQSSTTPTTISTQRAIPAPLYLPSNSRVSPVETTVYSIDATITEFALEADSDYHVVVSDASG